QIASEISKSQAKVAELYSSCIKSAEEQILQARTQLDSIDAQLGAIGEGQTDYRIVASESGRIHMLADYQEGMVVQAASPIASIGTENDRYKIVANVAASDAARIAKGDSVDIAVAGLPQNVYGSLTGSVAGIDTDATMPQEGAGEGAQPFFKVEVEPGSGYLVSKEGHKVNLSNGMLVETRIRYDKVSYFGYVLEALGVLVR
ncbi:MAG: HlyD family secretion protein, partial [Clostridiales Family XIII bacterium]|nr:HlyD family secretion protein [Clostridiales Family XIII bacterium]